MGGSSPPPPPWLRYWSSQGYAQRRSQEFGFGAALELIVQSHGRYVSAAANFSELVHPEV